MKRAQRRKASGSAKPPGNPLVASYPYLRFTVDQIYDMFKIYQIQLGSSPEDRDQIIDGIRSMGRIPFEHLLKSLKDRHKPQDNTYCLTLHDIHTEGVIFDSVGESVVSR